MFTSWANRYLPVLVIMLELVQQPVEALFEQTGFHLAVFWGWTAAGAVPAAWSPCTVPFDIEKICFH